jgi:hypothetical protein
MRKATIQQLQQDALNRYSHPSPWTFLANIAAGMNHSGSGLLPAMFAEGVGRATTQREADQEKALSDWDALNKEGETIDNNVDMLHERLGTAVGNMIERQSNADTMAQQRILARIDKLQKDREGLVVKLNPKMSSTDLNNAAVLANVFEKHGMALPVNPDGTARDPATLRLTDLPANLQNEAQWMIRINKSGWTPANIEGVLADSLAPADMKQTAQAIQANQVKQTGALAGARTTATGQAKQNLAGAAPVEMTQAGQNQMKEIGPVSKQFDELINELEPYKTDNNPLTLAGGLLKYKVGIASPVGTLANDISNLSLAKLQGMMPFASKSRAQKYFQQIGEHLPSTTDSPELIYDKLLAVRRNFLRMEQSSLEWETKHGGTSPPAPVLDPTRFNAYTRVARGDPSRAAQIAQEDGWAVGPLVKDPIGNMHYFANQKQAQAFQDALQQTGSTTQ